MNALTPFFILKANMVTNRMHFPVFQNKKT